jgi:hypothetical protein
MSTTASATVDEDERHVLTIRLDQLRDPDWMQPVLNRALGEMLSAPAAIADYKIDYCKIKPNRDINVALSATVRQEGAGRIDRRRLSCTLFPSAERGRQRFVEQSQTPIPPSICERLQQAGCSQPTVFLSDPPMIVRMFPVDPVLDGLATATDLPAIARLLGESLPCASAGPPQRVTFDVLHYKPLRTCTLHYRGYSGDAGETVGTPAYEAYGKVYRDDRGEICHQLLKATWEASEASDGRWRAARPLAYRPEERFVLQAAVPGRQFRHIFADLTHDDAGDDELREVERHLHAIAVAIRALQTSHITWGPQNTFERLLAGHEKNLMYLSRWHADLADEITLLRRELVRLERESPPGPLCIAHCDFAHGNVMIDESGVGIIDFDRAGQAEPAYDVAYFLTHMWSFGIRHPKREAHVKRLCEFFRRSYLELAPDVSSQRLALYEALDFVAYVMRNFRKQSHQGGWLNWARHQVGAAWGRLDEAGRTNGRNT